MPHFKKLYRFYGNENGKAIADYMTVFDEEKPDGEELEIFDPRATWKRKTIRDFTARELLVPVFINGECVYETPTLEEIRTYCSQQMETLWEEVRRFDNPHEYYVDLSDKLWNVQQELLHEKRS